MLTNFFNTKSSKRMTIKSSNDLKTSVDERIAGRDDSTPILRIPASISDAVKANANYRELRRILGLDEFTNQDALDMVKEWEPLSKAKGRRALDAMLWKHQSKYNECSLKQTNAPSIDSPWDLACENPKVILKKSDELGCDLQADPEEVQYHEIDEEKKYAALSGNLDDIRREEEKQDDQTRAIYLWRTTKLSQKSIAMKLDLSMYFVRSAVRAYKARVKQMIKLNREKSNKRREKVTPEQIDEIRSFFVMNKNKALTLGDVKEAVWKGQPPSVVPTDPTISRVLKAKLRMSYRRLNKHPPKILRGDHVRSFWEAVMIQTILRSNLYEIIYSYYPSTLHFLH